MQVHQEKKKAKFRISFIFLFVIVSFAACFVFYMRGDFDVSQAVLAQNDDSNSLLSFLNKDNVETIVNPVQASARANNSYFENIAFIGNSQMKGLSDYEFIPKENMYLNDSITFYNMNGADYGLEEFCTEKSAVYIMLGMKDLDNVGNEHLFDELDKLVEGLNNSDTSFYLVSLLPVTDTYTNDSVTNAKINAFNSEYLRYANEKKLHYIDINTMLVGNDGKMSDSTTEGDGYRLKKEFYSEISEYLLTHIA